MFTLGPININDDHGHHVHDVALKHNLNKDRSQLRSFLQNLEIYEEPLKRRGSDIHGRKLIKISENENALFIGCTLQFQGNCTSQPITDEEGNVLLWNGEIFGGVTVNI